MSVPKAASNLDCFLARREHYVGFPGQFFVMQPEPVSALVQQLSQREFRTCIFAPVRLHVPSSASRHVFEGFAHGYLGTDQFVGIRPTDALVGMPILRARPQPSATLEEPHSLRTLRIGERRRQTYLAFCSFFVLVFAIMILGKQDWAGQTGIRG